MVEGVGLALAGVAEDGHDLAGGHEVTAQLVTPGLDTVHADLLLLIQKQERSAVISTSMEIEALEVVGDNIRNTRLATSRVQHCTIGISAILTVNRNI